MVLLHDISDREETASQQMVSGEKFGGGSGMFPAVNAYLPRDFDIFSLLTVRTQEVRFSKLLIDDFMERSICTKTWTHRSQSRCASSN